MPYDDLVQLAADGTGKKVDMDKVSTAAGDTVYRQRAVMVGETFDLLQQLLLVNVQQLACLRAMLSILQADHPSALGELDFTQDLTPNDF
jgi:hypothetical protein